MKEKIRKILGEVSCFPESDFYSENQLLKEKLDSIELLEMTVHLEKGFNIEISNAEHEDLKTIASIIQLLKEKGIDDSKNENHKNQVVSSPFLQA